MKSKEDEVNNNYILYKGTKNRQKFMKIIMCLTLLTQVNDFNYDDWWLTFRADGSILFRSEYDRGNMCAKVNM